MQSDTHPSGVVYGTLCRVNFWVKMTTALGITQMVIGVACMVFYLVAYFLDPSTTDLIRYLGVGLVTGSVISSSGVLGLVASKRKSKCVITSFLVLSALSAMFAMFPLVLGIVGASSSSAEDTTLLMPICQLVFATVEIVVATWSVGVCCQAICCPNATFGHVSTRTPSTVGITQFITGGDGQHVVLFTSAPTQHTSFVYSVPNAAGPYILQNGIPSVQFSAQPGISCSVGSGQESITVCARPGTTVNPNVPPPSDVIAEGHAEASPKVIPPGNSPGHGASDEETDEGKKLLDHVTEDKGSRGSRVDRDGQNEASFEVEDEEAHLLT